MIQEIIGSEFAVIDANDTSDAQRLIASFSDTLKIVPNHFEVTASFLNFGNGFTYITDKDYSMAAELNISVTAKTEQNTTTQNYTSSCYAKTTDYNISYTTPSITPVDFLKNIHYKEMDTPTEGNSTIGNIFSLTIPSSIFSTDTNGSANLNIKINFDRNLSKSVNPFDLNITSIDMNDSNAEGNITLNQEATFIYGRTHAPRQRYPSSTGTASIYFESYCFQTGCDKSLLPNGLNSKRTNDIRWFINENHNALNDGNIGTVIQKDDTVVNVTAQNNASNPSTATLLYDASYGYPYKTTMENNASSWLIQDEDNPFATKNEFSVEFEGGASDWSGEHETDTTVDDKNVTKRTNRRSMW